MNEILTVLNLSPFYILYHIKLFYILYYINLHVFLFYITSICINQAVINYVWYFQLMGFPWWLSMLHVFCYASCFKKGICLDELYPEQSHYYPLKYQMFPDARMAGCSTYGQPIRYHPRIRLNALCAITEITILRCQKRESAMVQKVLVLICFSSIVLFTKGMSPFIKRLYALLHYQHCCSVCVNFHSIIGSCSFTSCLSSPVLMEGMIH
jgi:hypothetical protein